MILHIALKDLKIIFKDKKALAVMLLMPILIILILGSAFGNTFSKDISIKKFTVGLLNNDIPASMNLVRGNLENAAGNLFDIVDADNEKEADRMLGDKSASSVITIPKDFYKDINSNKPTKLEVKSIADDKIKSMLVESVTKGFAQGVSISYGSALAVIDESKKLRLSLPEGTNEMSQSSIIAIELAERLKNAAISFAVDEQEKNKNVSALQYYSIGMLLMFILFGANMGAKLLIEEREMRTLSRMMTTTAGKVTIIIGKFLGLFVICLTQAAILITFTDLAFGVYWGGSIPGLILVTLCCVFASSGMFMFIASISKTSRAADGFSQIFIQLFTILGGGMIPVYIMPKAMQMAAKVTINWWGMKGYLNLMADVGPILTFCTILLAMGIIYLTVGIKKFRVE
jgi:ABC-2 type transport system permease protein